MTDLIELASGKLNDPILMDWAIDRYRQSRKGRSQRQEAMEQAWFDELALRRWLNSDDQETLNRLFAHLPEEQLANLAKSIGNVGTNGVGAWRTILLRMFDPEEVAPVLMETIERERRTYGSVWVAKAMGQLRWSTLIHPLTDTRCEDCGDFLCEAAKEALIRIGEPAQDYMIHHWDSFDNSQRIYGLSVIEAVGGEPAALFAFVRYDELFQDDPENRCQLAQ